MLSFSVATVFGLLLWPSCEEFPVLETLHRPLGLAQGRVLVSLIRGGMTRKKVSELLGDWEETEGGIAHLEDYYLTYGIKVYYCTATGLINGEVPEPRVIRIEWTFKFTIEYEKPQYIREWD